MSTRGQLDTLVRLAPEITTGLLSTANLDILFNRAQADIAVRGRALPKHVKFNAIASQQEYVISGASALVTDNDFLAVDLRGGGVLFNDGSRWLGSSKEGASDGLFEPKTKEWLDANYPNWRTNAATTSPLYWYLDGDASANMVIGLVDKPSASGTNNIWLHYLARGKFTSNDSNFFWTDSSTNQFVHLEAYEMLFVWYVLDYVQRVILHNPQEANLYKQMYETGLAAMANRLPLSDAYGREGFKVPGYFSQLVYGRGRY